MDWSPSVDGFAHAASGGDDGGLSCRGATARFGVAPSTAICWQAQRLETGTFAPKRQGGDMRSRRVEERAVDILALWETRKDISLEELSIACPKRA